ncbi:MAG: bacteriohemerythrin [Betaproteobacteria bacterium]|jgi:hemerythrin|nr:bacteriohemerythrin [Rhodocyclales bacterium]
MPQKMTWHSGYSVGNAGLDEQHKQLLALCNKAADCMEDDSARGREQFHVILNDLCIYAEQHFRTEEVLLGQHHYAGLTGHKAEHEDYQAKLVGFLYSASFGIIDKEGLRRYLSDWWIHHILESDMQYRPLFARAHAAQ